MLVGRSDSLLQQVESFCFLLKDVLQTFLKGYTNTYYSYNHYYLYLRVCVCVFVRIARL